MRLLESPGVYSKADSLARARFERAFMRLQGGKDKKWIEDKVIARRGMRATYFLIYFRASAFLPPVYF